MKNIIVNKNILEKIDTLINVNQFSKIAILTDKNVAKHWLTVVNKSLKRSQAIIIKAGEKEKNIKTIEEIWSAILKNGLDRRSLLINLGGGVICDLGGFAASTFMRGIKFLNIPTTLLAQIDASVGGKTGIDFDEIKNAVGVFKNPTFVIIDIATLKTLPKRELSAAFGEIIKHGIISGRKHFGLVTSKKPEEFNEQELIEIIKQSIKIKSNIVKKDPKETTGQRKVLNFGHTIGHAVESLSWKTDKPLLHGEAVAIGIVGESKLAQLAGMLPESDFLTIKKVINHAGLPTRTKNLSVKDILQGISFDKKNIRKTILWSLPEKIGKVVINIKTPNDLMIKAINSII